jgi:peptide/nickel transport system substrate-binding protein
MEEVMSQNGNHLTRRDFLRLASLAAGGVVVARCASPTAAPESGVAPAATAAVSAPKVGGTLTIGATAGIPQLDPHVVTFANERLYFPGLYNGITEYNEAMEPVPCLAESWEVSDDVMTYTWHLRKGVKFHNGRELEAEDIKWNFERCLDEKLGSQLRQNVQEVQDIEVVDKYTVKMHLSAPSAILPMGAQELKIIAKESLDNINKAPVGTGPYKFQDFIPDETLTLQRYDEYWGGKPYLDKVVITAIKDSTAALTALKTGQWDFFRGVSVPDGASLKDDPTSS